MKEISLTRGYVTMVDDEDFEELSAYKWYANTRARADGSVLVYSVRKVRKAGGKCTEQQMHNSIVEVPRNMRVDHIDGDGLNNTRANLRVCTNAENRRNQRAQSGRSSKYKGVTWHAQAKRWQAQIQVEKKSTYLGLFVDEGDAARAYDAAAVSFHGDFARLNMQGAKP